MVLFGRDCDLGSVAIQRQPYLNRRIRAVAHHLHMMPLKSGRQQGAIAVNVFVEIGKVEDCTFRQFPLGAQPLGDFFLGKDFQFSHVVLRTFHHSESRDPR